MGTLKAIRSQADRAPLGRTRSSHRNAARSWRISGSREFGAAGCEHAERVLDLAGAFNVEGGVAVREQVKFDPLTWIEPQSLADVERDRGLIPVPYKS
ncbi:MAG: hypothetical protein IT513_15270 [Burkholderiales bacterium]|nr:hypothetical protein [Burkholderiales bacterium]